MEQSARRMFEHMREVRVLLLEICETWWSLTCLSSISLDDIFLMIPLGAVHESRGTLSRRDTSSTRAGSSRRHVELFILQSLSNASYCIVSAFLPIFWDTLFSTALLVSRSWAS